MDIHDFQDLGEAYRQELGIDGTAGDAQDIRHPYLPEPGGTSCLACGLAEPGSQHSGPRTTARTPEGQQ